MKILPLCQALGEVLEQACGAAVAQRYSEIKQWEALGSIPSTDKLKERNISFWKKLRI